MQGVEAVQVAVVLLHYYQVLHLLMASISNFHFGVTGLVDWVLLARAQGTLGGNAVSLVLLIRRIQEDVALLILFYLNT